MPSNSEENYLKAIYKLNEKTKKGASTTALSEALQTKAGSVTEMIKRLSEKNLVNYQPYQGVTLSASGKKLALNIIRKHRLWEVFLVEKLKFGWDQVHEIAEELEHIDSDDLINKLDAFLGYPEADPHGDPIPNVNGEIKRNEHISISKLRVGGKGLIVGVIDHSTAFLQFLDKNCLTLGKEIEVKDITDYDQSVQIIIGKTIEKTISHEVSKNILINTRK